MLHLSSANSHHASITSMNLAARSTYTQGLAAWQPLFLIFNQDLASWAFTIAGIGSMCGASCLTNTQMRQHDVEAGLLTCEPSSPLRTFKVTLSPTLKSSSAIARSAALVTLRPLIPMITSPAGDTSSCHSTSARVQNMAHHKGHMCLRKLGEVVAYV